MKVGEKEISVGEGAIGIHIWGERNDTGGVGGKDDRRGGGKQKGI